MYPGRMDIDGYRVGRGKFTVPTFVQVVPYLLISALELFVIIIIIFFVTKPYNNRLGNPKVLLLIKKFTCVALTFSSRHDLVLLPASCFTALPSGFVTVLLSESVALSSRAFN